VVACLEGDWRPSWRVGLFPEYKLNRIDESGDETEPDTLSPQIPILLDVLDAFGIPMLGDDDYEADDLIATFSVSQQGPIRIVTGDRDLFQLVDDKRDIQVIYLAQGVSNHDCVNQDWISKRYDIPGERYGLYAMIRGDASAGLPGIRGIGDKGATSLAKIFSSLKDIVKAAEENDDRLPAKYRAKIINDLDYARIATKLVGCATDVPIPNKNVYLEKSTQDMKKIRHLQKEFGLGTSIHRIVNALNLN
jgi:5'-3' exonuclease